jgi:hypothetical protein
MIRLGNGSEFPEGTILFGYEDEDHQCLFCGEFPEECYCNAIDPDITMVRYSIIMANMWVGDN